MSLPFSPDYLALLIASSTAALNASLVTVAPDTLSTPSVPLASTTAFSSSTTAGPPISSVSV